MSPLSRRGRSTRSARPPGKGRVHANSRRRSGGERSSLVVQETLAGYAKRGVFRAYGDQPSGNGQSRFSFRWHADATFQIVYDPRRRELIFRDVLPGVPARSGMYRDLKAFVEGRSSPALPEHRRIDPRKARVTVTNRRGMVSLAVSLKNAHLEYGVRRAVNLIHELFVEFLRNPLYFSYMVEHFQLDPDL
jgi:hypothetical protein